MAEQEEAPKEEEPQQEQEEEAAAQEYEAPAQEEEAPAQEEEPEEAPKEEEAAPAEEAPKEEEPPKAEEPAKEEEPPKVEEPKPAATEEKKEEPKAPSSPKRKKKKKKKKAASGDGSNAAADALWSEISSKKATSMNWYITKLDGKVGKTTTLKEVSKGTGGALEVIEFLKDKKKDIMFGILKAVTTDDSKSVRSKFIYIRFIGSGVSTMNKAKLTGSIGKIDDAFPCKHLTVDINENCDGDLSPETLSKELLRVGGAHKPDLISFGPDQDIDVKSYKNN